MSDELSINPERNQIDLHSDTDDRKAAVARAFLGLTPVFGSVLTEIVNQVIPNLKQERIALFAELLEKRVAHLETDFLINRLSDPELADVLEDAFSQASRSQSDERRSYIANLIATGIETSEFRHLETKKLLALLNELNDAEIVLLKSTALSYPHRDEFCRKYPELFFNYHSTLGPQSQTSIDERNAFKDGYWRKLQEVGLVEAEYEVIKPERGSSRFMEPPPQTVPKYNSDGKPVVKSTRITGMGRRLLKYIESGSS